MDWDQGAFQTLAETQTSPVAYPGIDIRLFRAESDQRRRKLRLQPPAERKMTDPNPPISDPWEEMKNDRNDFDAGRASAAPG
jgi:hypothetical protein